LVGAGLVIEHDVAARQHARTRGLAGSRL
jgi:hypothetical protein